MSKMVQVRNVPDDVHGRLRAQASAGMSLSDYVSQALRRLVEEARIEEVLKEAGREGGAFSFEDVNEIIHDARAER
jgi:hypothetical protein